MLKIQDLVTLAADAAIDLARADAKAATLKARAVAEAERIRTEVGSADRFASDQKLGVLRLDGADKPAAPVVTKDGEFGSFLAERAPEHAAATITVPAQYLAAALSSLEFAGIPQVEADVRPASSWRDWVDGSCVIQADPDTAGGWVVLYVDEEKHTHVVPGLSAVKPQPRWVLAPNQDLKRERAELGMQDAEEHLQLMAGDDNDAAPDVAPAPARIAHDPQAAAAHAVVVQGGFSTPDIEADRMMQDLERMGVANLRAIAQDAGLPSGGSKVALRARIRAHIEKQTAAPA